MPVPKNLEEKQMSPWLANISSKHCRTEHSQQTGLMKVFIRLYTIRGNINGDTSYLIEKWVQRLQLHQLLWYSRLRKIRNSRRRRLRSRGTYLRPRGRTGHSLDAYRNWIKTALIWSCMHSTELTEENWCLGKMPDWNLSVSPRYTTSKYL